MKRFFLVTLGLVGLMAIAGNNLFAQEKSEVLFNPHWYMQIRGGGAYTLGEADFGDLLSPAVDVMAGYRFTPVWGLRGGLAAWQAKGASFLSEQKDYAYKFVQLNADAVFDIANCLSGFNERRFFNPYLLAGVGFNYAFDNVEAENLASVGHALTYLWRDSRCFATGRFGVGMDFRICDAVSFNLEGNANILSDHFNSKKAGNADWHFNALAGISIRLGKGYTKKEMKEEPLPQIPVSKPVPQPEKKETTVPVPVKKTEVKPMSTCIYFSLNSSVVRDTEKTKIQELVTYLTENSEMKVTITGYADKQTGNPRYNKILSERRAKEVVEILENAGIARSRIILVAKGDEEQPFPEQEKNRVVICITEDMGK